jgi:hypothetical protein
VGPGSLERGAQPLEPPVLFSTSTRGCMHAETVIPKRSKTARNTANLRIVLFNMVAMPTHVRCCCALNNGLGLRDPCDTCQVILAYLVGMGHEEPLRYRLLPVEQFANTGGALPP